VINEQVRLYHPSVHKPAVLVEGCQDGFAGLRLEVYALFNGHDRVLVDRLVLTSEQVIEAWERAHLRWHANRGEHEAALREGELVAAQWGPTPRRLFGGS
jgi:hypothetical protein